MQKERLVMENIISCWIYSLVDKKNSSENLNFWVSVRMKKKILLFLYFVSFQLVFVVSKNFWADFGNAARF